MTRRLVSLLALLAASIAHADGGRVPIAAPTVISIPGEYLVTRDLHSTSGVVVRITADDVTLDLGGHELSHQDPAASIVVVEGNDATIRNGRLSGGGRGIFHSGGARIRLEIEGLLVRGAQYAGVAVDPAEYVEVRSSRFENIDGGSAIDVSGGSAALSARIVDNTVVDCALGIAIWGAHGAEIRGNVLLGTLSATGPAIHLGSDPGWEAGGNLIAGNLVRGGLSYGIGIEVTTGDNVIEGNTVSSNGDSGIAVWSGGNDIRGNVCAANAFRGISALGSSNRIRDNLVVMNAADGIVVGGQHQWVESNLSEENGGAGIVFNGSGHAHRGNMLRDNTGGAVVGGANSTDAGGNIQ